jgi:hypothetical protein
MYSSDNTAAFKRCKTTIYYADQDSVILLMWHNNKVLVNIDIIIIEDKFNVLVVELLARNETEALMDNVENLIQMLFDQGLELSF